MAKPRQHVKAISFGGGVQSWAMAVMAVNGLIPDAPNLAIMADPGDEAPATWAFMQRHRGYLESRGFVLRTVRREGLGLFEHDRTMQRGTVLPVRLVDLTQGKPRQAGIANRTCTARWKVVPFRKELRRIGATSAVACIGISLDEAHRGGKPTGVQWLTNRYPLIELKWTRDDCKAYLMETLGEVPPSSACLGCPLLKLEHWSMLRQQHPERFAQAVQDEAGIRERFKLADRGLDAFMATGGEVLPLAANRWERKHAGRQLPLAFDGAELAECEGVCFV